MVGVVQGGVWFIKFFERHAEIFLQNDTNGKNGTVFFLR